MAERIGRITAAQSDAFIADLSKPGIERDAKTAGFSASGEPWGPSAPAGLVSSSFAKELGLTPMPHFDLPELPT